MKGKNIFWGLLFLCAGVMLVLKQFHYFEGVNVFSLIVSSFLAVIAISSVPRRNWFFVIMPIMFIVWINREAFMIEGYIQFWPLMLAGCFTSLGLSLIFKSDYYGCYHRWNGGNWKEHHAHSGYERGSQNDDHVRFSTSFSSSSQYLYSTNLQTVKLNCTLGSLQVYFDQAVPCADGVGVEVYCELGSVELYIPRDWKVENNVSATLGSVEEDYRFGNAEKTGPTISIKGSVKLGSIEIIYV